MAITWFRPRCPGRPGAPLLPAGFYYKTFLGPGRDAWYRRWEPLIRRMAGLGRAPEAPDPDRYGNRHAHCETLVIGAGRAGIAAALAAAEAGIASSSATSRPSPAAGCCCSLARCRGWRRCAPSRACAS
ncbi:hypothetical protein ACFQU2_33710 [Siccirubricoccus deserti]